MIFTDRPDNRPSLQALACRLLFVSFLSGLFFLSGPSDAGENVTPPPNIARLAEELPSNPRWVYAEQRVQYLLKKHDVDEEDLLAFLQSLGEGRRYSKERDLWWVILLTGTQRSMKAFADRAFERADYRRWSGVKGAAFYASSEDLSRALVQKVESVKGTRGPLSQDETIGWAVETISKHPVPEAFPLLSAYLLKGRKGYTGYAASALGRLNSPEALEALEQAWIEVRARHWIEDGLFSALAIAIAQYGDRGVEAFARIAEGQEGRSHVFLGLRHVGSPAAVRLAEALYNPSDINSRTSLLNVRIAAGEPYRTPALLAALEQEESPFIRRIAVDKCRDLEEPNDEIRTAMWRLALGPDKDLARRATYCLEIWTYRDHEDGDQVRWAGPSDGLALGIEDSRYEDRWDGGLLACVVQVKNVGTRAVLLPNLDDCWVLTASGYPKLAGADASDSRLWPLPPGATGRIHLRFSLAGDPPEWRQALTVQIHFRAEERHHEKVAPYEGRRYEGLGFERWTGELRTPKVAASIQLPITGRDLEHWRQMLAEGRDKGRLPEGASIEWQTWPGGHFGGEGPRGTLLAIRSGKIESIGILYAMPQDLLSIEPQELKDLCRLLLQDDMFADMIDRRQMSWGGGGPPRAEFRLTYGTQRGISKGWLFRPPVQEALHEFTRQLVESRSRQMRRRLGMPAEPPESSE